MITRNVKILFSAGAAACLILLFTNAVVIPSYPYAPVNQCWQPGPRVELPYKDEIAFHMRTPAFSKIIRKANPSKEVQASAVKLQSMLKELLHVDFPIVDGSVSDKGIFLGTARDYAIPGINPAVFLNNEAYLLRTTPTNLYIIGTTEAGLRHGIWDFLYRMGYRRFFPGNDWRIIPQQPFVAHSLNHVCNPAFNQREINFSYGAWPERGAEYREWKEENRMGGRSVSIAEIYHDIIYKNKDLFEANPSMRGKWRNGKPSAKLCVTHPLVEEVVKNYVNKHWANREFVTMSPSDDLGWEGCNEDENKIGGPATPSNRAVYLANLVAKEINKDPAKPRFVGMLAYSQHAAPPTIRLHPKIIVSVATVYSTYQDGNTNDLFARWRKMGATMLSTYEYFSIIQWDRDLPGKARVADLVKMQQLLQQHQKNGTKFFIAEAGDNWGPMGLPYWAASQLFWNPNLSIKSLQQDFLYRSFPKTFRIMKNFYDLQNGPRPLYSKDLPIPSLLGRLYRILDEALKQNPGPAETKRLRSLVMYLKHSEFFSNFERTKGGVARQAAFEKMMKFHLANRLTGLTHNYGHWLHYYDLMTHHATELYYPPGTSFSDRRDTNPWLAKGAMLSPNSPAVDQFLRRGIQLPDYNISTPYPQPKQFMPLTPGPVSEQDLAVSFIFSAPQTLRYYAQTAGERVTIRLTAQGSPGKVEAKFCSDVDGSVCITKTVAVEVKQAPVDVTFIAPAAGNYQIKLDDRGHGLYVYWKPGTKISIVASYTERAQLVGAWAGGYVYVPAGVTSFRMHSGWDDIGDWYTCPVACNGSNKIPIRNDASGMATVNVPKGTDGKLWFVKVGGTVSFYGIPPVISARPEEYLLPVR